MVKTKILKITLICMTVVCLLGLASYYVINRAADFFLMQLVSYPTEPVNNQPRDEETPTPSPQGDLSLVTPQPTTQGGNPDARPTPVQPKPEPTSTYDPNVTVDKIEKSKKDLTLGEKAQITAILLKRLSASDLNLFTRMASDGLTVDEKKQAKKIILQKLSPQEYDELIVLAKKLGVSQGKKYVDSVKGYKETSP